MMGHVARVGSSNKVELLPTKSLSRRICGKFTVPLAKTGNALSEGLQIGDWSL
jgi:hypothetical protein